MWFVEDSQGGRLIKNDPTLNKTWDVIGGFLITNSILHALRLASFHVKTALLT
jgi:hypothetical protein